MPRLYAGFTTQCQWQVLWNTALGARAASGAGAAMQDNAGMETETITSPGGSGHNEDLVEVWRRDGCTDVVLLDGGTSVADRHYVDALAGDVAWFVRTFCAELRSVAAPDLSQADSVEQAVHRVRQAFERETQGVDVPVYAWPIAAITWVRYRHDGTLATYCLGDCKAFLHYPDGRVLDLDPYVNPQELVLQSELARLAKEGVIDPVTRRERLVPMLRERRVFLNTSPDPAVLCMQPRGPFHPRTRSLQAPLGATLLCMTDGLYRIVDTYQLRTIEELAALVARDGLQAAMDELRDFERKCLGADTLAVKSADDATAVSVKLSTA